MLSYISIVLIAFLLVYTGLYFLLREHFYRTEEAQLLQKAEEIASAASRYFNQEIDLDTLNRLIAFQPGTPNERIWLVFPDGQMVEYFSRGPGRGRSLGNPGGPGNTGNMGNGNLGNNNMGSNGHMGNLVGPRVRFPQAEELSPLWEGKTLVQRRLKPPYPGGTDEPQLSVAVPIPQQTDPATIIGAVFINSPTADLSSLISSTNRLIFFTLLISCGLALLLGYYLARYITRPLREMNRVALAMAQGEYYQRVAAPTDDELGELGGSLNHLAKELNRAMTAAEKLEQMRRDFVANVSHELRAPLTLVRGYTQVLSDPALVDSDRDKYLQIIQEETLRMERLITELLDLSRLESGKAALEKEKVELYPLTVGLISRYESRARDQGLTIELEADPDLPAVLGDGDRLEQILIIFLDNALNYTPAGGLVQVALHARSDSDACLTQQQQLPFENLQQRTHQPPCQRPGEHQPQHRQPHERPQSRTHQMSHQRPQQHPKPRDHQYPYEQPREHQPQCLQPQPAMVEIQIRDTGMGIAAEDLPFIWERFFKADKSRSRSKDSTGLGLAIARQLIELHGGSVSVSSEIRQGTTFTFTLPQA